MDLGQVFTNGSVATYMVSMFGLKKEASILDPCFGAGVFLTASIQHGFTNIEGYEIDKELYESVRERFPAITLYNEDFLKAVNTKKYDGIIMNPPYIRQEKIDDLKSLGITKAQLRKNRIYEQLPSTANMYMYFIVKALDLLKDDGELVVIFPSSWIDARSGKLFKEALESKATIIKQVHITGEVFEKTALVEVVILKLQKGKVNSNIKVTYLEIRNGQICEVEKTSDFAELKLDIPFSRYATVRRGLTTGYNAMYINPELKRTESREYLVPIISSPKLITGYGTKDAELDDLLYVQEDANISDEIKRYIKRWEKDILNKKSPKTLYQKIQNDKSWYTVNLVDGKGIIFSYFVRNDMKFVLNESGYLVRDNFYIIKPHIDEYLMFSLLNNHFTYYQLEKRGKKYGAGLLKLQRYDVEALNFPDINVFSDVDRSKLISLSKELAGIGNKNNIIKITEILSNYLGVNLGQIVDMYESIKKFRLEGKG